MSEEIRENLNLPESDTAEMSGEDFATENLYAPEMDAPEMDAPKADKPKKSEKPAKPEKPTKTKAHRMTKEEKKEAREAAKNKSKAQKAWEDSIVANKRVKREEINRKLKKAMLIILIFSLLITSTVYIMLLFIDENNVRITATSDIQKSISMSVDGKNWTPYLDIDGPDNMWNISYNPDYDTETIPPNIAELEKYLQENAEGYTAGGNKSQPYLISFCFYLRNTSKTMVPYSYEMHLEANDKGLENSMRVMWSTHVIGNNAEREDRPQTQTNIYAALSSDERLAWNEGVELVAYPANSDSWTAEQLEYYYNGMSYNDYSKTYEPFDEELKDGKGNYKYDNPIVFLNTTGYINTIPFYNDEYVIKDTSYLDMNEMACIYVCVWIEGSDFDCTDKALDGYVTLSIKFATA